MKGNLDLGSVINEINAIGLRKSRSNVTDEFNVIEELFDCLLPFLRTSQFILEEDKGIIIRDAVFNEVVLEISECGIGCRIAENCLPTRRCLSGESASKVGAACGIIPKMGIRWTTTWSLAVTLTWQCSGLALGTDRLKAMGHGVESMERV